MNVMIQSVHFDADQKLKDFIIKKTEKLQTYFDRIIECNVTLGLEPNGTPVKDKVVVMKLQIPGVLLVAKERAKSFEESVDLAVDSLRRQIRKRKTKLRQHA